MFFSESARSLTSKGAIGVHTLCFYVPQFRGRQYTYILLLSIIRVAAACMVIVHQAPGIPKVLPFFIVSMLS